MRTRWISAKSLRRRQSTAISAGSVPAAMHSPEPLGQPLDLVLAPWCAAPCAPDLARIGPARAAAPRRRAGAPTGSARRAGSRETALAASRMLLAVAEAGQQVERIAAAWAREVLGEPQQVADRRAPPAVDRLARVTHGRHRMTAGEQGRQQHPLGHTGVLVLVEEHQREPLALGGTDLGTGLPRSRPPAPPGHRSRPGRARPCGRGSARPGRAGRPRILHLSPISRSALTPPVTAAALAIVRASNARTSAGSRRCSAISPSRSSMPLGDGARHPRPGVVRARRRPYDPQRELPAPGLGEQPRVGLAADPQGVVLDQRGGVGVVGRHRRLVVRLGLGSGRPQPPVGPSRPAGRARHGPGRRARTPPCW